VEAFDATAGEGVVGLAQGCGIIVSPSSSVSASTSAASATTAASPSSHVFTSKSAGLADGTFWKMNLPGLVAVIAVGLILM
jgi:hypothetical protein